MTSADRLGLPADLQRAVDFHGHVCPGLVIGYRAAKAAAHALQVETSGDEELILIAENDSCSVDAFQVLLSTTFGKGNLYFRDHGKQVFTVGDRHSERAVRVALRNDTRDRMGDSREERIQNLLGASDEDILNVQVVDLRLPDKAEIHETLQCARCREGVMSTRTSAEGDKVYCLPCASDLGIGH